jgi:hypothetical protein
MIHHGNHPYIIKRTNHVPYQVTWSNTLSSDDTILYKVHTVNQKTAKNTFNFAYGGVGLQDVTISDSIFKISNNSATNSNNGAIFLENCKNVALKNLAITADDNIKHGQGIHLIGCENVTIQNCVFRNRVSCISTFFVNDLTITGCFFVKFNEGIDIDKPSQDIDINNCRFINGSRNSNEAIDCNASKTVKIKTNRFTDCGRILFFNGKEGVTATYQDWLQLDWESPEKPEGLLFIKGADLTFTDNTIEDCYCNQQNSLIILGNKFSRGEATSDLHLLGNNVTDSGKIIIQDVINCNI